MTNPRDKRVELVLQSMESLPTLPAVAMRVLSAVSNPSTNAEELTRIISSDGPLTARLLQLTRRADSGARGSNDLNRAVVLLGFEVVRAAVLAISVFDSFKGPAASSNHAGFDRSQFWKHSIAVGCCAELLAGLKPTTAQSHEPRLEPADAFVGGLLHDLGKIALDCILPKSFARVVEATDMLRGNIADLELRVIGLDHMVVGKRLAERWNLPPALRDCIWLHGQDPVALPHHVVNARLVNLVTLADVLVRQQHIGYSGNHTVPSNNESLLNAVGLTGDQATSVLARLVGEVESRCTVLGLGESTSGELYRQALDRANQELGAINNQLANKAKQVATRKKFFEALSEFQSEIRPDAAVGHVLTAIGQTAANILETTAIAVFSLQPGGAFASVVVVDADGKQDTMLVDVPADYVAAANTATPVNPVGNELEWLSAVVSPKLSGAQRFCIALAGDHRNIGGVLWGAAIDESQRLAMQFQELAALSGGWGLALRVAQIREDSQSLAEQLAETNRRLQAMQDELLRSRMLISVGEMAAGAAHEMNNPLAVISGRSQLLASQLTDPRQKSAAKLIHDQSDRLSEIITELMDFAQPPRPTLSNCDIKEVIETAIAEAKLLAKEGTDSVDRTIERDCNGCAGRNDRSRRR